MAQPYRNTALSTTAAAVKAPSSGAFGKLHYLEVTNPNASVSYIHVYDTAAAISAGTTVPAMTFGIAANSGRTIPCDGFKYTAELNLSASTAADGSGAPGTGLVVVAFYD